MLKTWTRICYVVFETTIDTAQSPSSEESFGADSLMNTQKTFQCKKLNNAGLVLVRITTAMSLDLFFFRPCPDTGLAKLYLPLLPENE